MYGLTIRAELDKSFKKLSKKDPDLLRKINNKVLDIRSKPNNPYKFLHNPLASFNRVHIDNHFVLIFKINHEEKVVTLYHFDHHDKAYKWRP